MTNSRAFTLIEMLVAMTILVLLMALLGTLSSRMGDTWTHQQSLTEIRQTTRAVTDIIARDLRTAMLPADPQDQASLQFVHFEPDTALPDGWASGVPAELLNPQALFWQAPVAEDTSRGDLAVVGYFLRWATENGKPVGRLCRLFIQPTDTVLSQNDFAIHTAPDAWLTPALLEAYAPAQASTLDPGDVTAANHFRGLIAENVVGLWMNCFRDPPMLAGNAAPLPGFDSRKEQGLPRVVEVSFALLDNRTAARLTTTQRDALQSLANTATDAADFANEVTGNTSLASLSRGLHTATVTIPLENSK